MVQVLDGDVSTVWDAYVQSCGCVGTPLTASVTVDLQNYFYVTKIDAWSVRGDGGVKTDRFMCFWCFFLGNMFVVGKVLVVVFF